ncbi:hypothetical protein DAMA08_037830 [Martiniozyma asiatica (nom. inval.)]|nr:hypothetical protein DAMA08_037830 [Martiniozyma asiatica]
MGEQRDLDELDDLLNEFPVEESHNGSKKLLDELNLDSATSPDFSGLVDATLRRVNQSTQNVDETAQENAAKGTEEDLLATLLKSLDIDGDFDLEGLGLGEGDGDDGNGNGNGNGDGDGLDNLLLDALSKLTSKALMYDTINSACSKYDSYMATIEKSNPDYERYLKQHTHMRNIKLTFDSGEYSDDNSELRDYIDAEMEKFNDLYPPPPEVMDDNLKALGADQLNWNDGDVPWDQKDLDGCQQQ